MEDLQGPCVVTNLPCDFSYFFIPPSLLPGLQAWTITILKSGHLVIRFTSVPFTFTPTDKGHSLSKGTFILKLSKYGSVGAVSFQISLAERVGIPAEPGHESRAQASAWGTW